MIIGIVGGGQLARMLALAGIPLGMKFIILDPAEDACAAPLGEHLCGEYDDTELLKVMADKCDVVTYEFENVPATSIAFLSQSIEVFPSEHSLATTNDRLLEKTMFNELKIPTVPIADIQSEDDLNKAVNNIGLPAILKTRTLGYDGKGQFKIKQQDDVKKAWQELGGVPLILEGFANFKREVSIIAVRGHDGETRFYPLSENIHQNGILKTAYSRPGDAMQSKAEEYAEHILDKFKYVGVMALELFDTGDELLANEMAPRVHNSAHWTIEGAVTSQFENHLRAIARLPLGSTAANGYVKMTNYIGEIPEKKELLSIPGLHLHDYNKKARPGRKVGHATQWSNHKLD